MDDHLTKCVLGAVATTAAIVVTYLAIKRMSMACDDATGEQEQEQSSHIHHYNKTSQQECATQQPEPGIIKSYQNEPPSESIQITKPPSDNEQKLNQKQSALNEPIVHDETASTPSPPLPSDHENELIIHHIIKRNVTPPKQLFVKQEQEQPGVENGEKSPSPQPPQPTQSMLESSMTTSHNNDDHSIASSSSPSTHQSTSTTGPTIDTLKSTVKNMTKKVKNVLRRSSSTMKKSKKSSKSPSVNSDLNQAQFDIDGQVDDRSTIQH